MLKSILALIAALTVLAVSAQAASTTSVTNTVPVITTNQQVQVTTTTTTPVVANPVIPIPTNGVTFESAVEQVISTGGAGMSNWIFNVDARYMPGVEKDKQWGADLGAYWKINNYAFTGPRLTMAGGTLYGAGGTATVQLPIKLFGGKLSATPYAYTGIMEGLSGLYIGGLKLPGKAVPAGPQGVLGSGFAAVIPINANCNFIANGAYERTTTIVNSWTLGLGLGYNF